MGRKCKRVHEQSVLWPMTTKPSRSSLHRSKSLLQLILKSGLGFLLLLGLMAPVSRAEPTRPTSPAVCLLHEKCQYCSFCCCRSDNSHVHVWKLGLVGVDLLDDGVRECWPWEVAALGLSSQWPVIGWLVCLFFCSALLRCDLLAKKVPGRAPYSQHIIIRNWT